MNFSEDSSSIYVHGTMAANGIQVISVTTIATFANNGSIPVSFNTNMESKVMTSLIRP